MDRDQQTPVRCRQRGAAIVEASIALPILLVIILGAIQFGLIYQAKATLNHASLQAARAGAVGNASPGSIRQGLARGLLPLASPAHSLEGVVVTTAQIEAQLPLDARLRILNPTREAFTDFAEEVDGQQQIPNDRLHARGTAEGSASGLNIQDANLLKVEVTYGFPLRVPIVGWFISHALLQTDRGADAFTQQLLRRSRLPILASATVRMQSPARLSDLVMARTDLREVPRRTTESRTEDRQESRAATTGDADEEAEKKDKAGGSSLADRFLGFGSEHEQRVTAVPGDSPKKDASATRESESPSTATATSAGDKQAAPFCTPAKASTSGADTDSGVLKQIWGELKSLAGTAVDFIKGFWEGIREQLDDLVELITDPLEVAKGLYQLARDFIDDPPGTARTIGQAIGKDLQQLVSCGAFDRGRVLGSNVDPAFMLKLATKLAKFGRLAHAVEETKRAFGCASFAAGTSVWNGDHRSPIESIDAGDPVTSRDRTTLHDGPHDVARTFHRFASDYVLLVTEDEVLQVTAEHPVWVQGAGWIEVGDLRPGDPIATVSGDVLVRETIRVVGPKEVFNLSVPETQSYFAGAGGLWVHNANCAIPPIYRAPRSPSGYALGATDGGSGSWRDVRRASNSPSSEAAYRYQQQITGAPRNGSAIREYRLGDVDFDGYDAERDVLIDAKHYTEFCPLADCKPEFLQERVAQSLFEQAVRQIEELKTMAVGSPIEWHVADKEMAKKIRTILSDRLKAIDKGRIVVLFTPDITN